MTLSPGAVAQAEVGYRDQGKAEGKKEEERGLTVIIDPTTYSDLDLLAHNVLEEVGR